MNCVTVDEFDSAVDDHMKVCGSSFKSLYQDGCISVGCTSCEEVFRMPYDALLDLGLDSTAYRNLVGDINRFEDIFVGIINESILNGEVPGFSGSLMEKLSQ